MSEKIKASQMLVTANNYIEKLRKFAETVNIEFDDYQRTCVFNAIRSVNNVLATNKKTWNDIQVDNIVTVLEQVAFLHLNPSATPRECYFIIRNNQDKKTGTWSQELEFGVEGAGNDIILSRFGKNVAEVKSYIVYEGDEFTPGFMNGWDLVLPTYQRTFKTNKPEKAVYLIKKTNGEIDVQYADTEDVKKSLLANAKQNGADEKLLREINKESLYEILNNPKWLDYKIVKEYTNKYGKKSTKETRLFNPSYTGVSSMYNMIERKLRNHATRKYPKDFSRKEIAELYEKTFDDLSYEPQKEIETPEEKITISNKEFENNSASEKIKLDDRPKLVVEKEEKKIECGTAKGIQNDTLIESKEEYVYEDTTVTMEKQQGEIREPKQEKVEETKTEEEQVVVDDDEPNWDD